MLIDWNTIDIDILKESENVKYEIDDELNASGETTLTQFEVDVIETEDDMACLDEIIKDVESEQFIEIDNIDKYLLNDDENTEFDKLMTSGRNPMRSNKEKKEVKRLDSCYCNICDRKFPSNAYLVRHYRTKGHLREKLKLEDQINFERVIEVMDETDIKEEISEDIIIEEMIVDDQEYLKVEELQVKKEIFNQSSMKDFYESYTVTTFDEGGINQIDKTSSETTCQICSKTFTKRGYLLQHNLTYHSGDKPYKCSKCGKRYADEIALNHHQLKHGNSEKIFKCLKCSRSYINKIDLKRHEAIHKDSMPHTCTICKKGFARRDHLEKHFMVHQKKLNKGKA